MCDIFSFLSTMKISWLRRLDLDCSSVRFVLNLYPLLKNIDKFGGEYANNIMQRINNPFWHDVAKHYKKLCNKYTVDSAYNFLSEHIHYNANITRDKKVIFVKQWVDANIYQIKDLMNNDLKFCTYEEFKQKYPAITRTNFLMYEGIIQTLKRYHIKLGYILATLPNNLDSGVWQCIRKGNEAVKTVLLGNAILPTASKKWNNIFAGLNWKRIFSKCFKTTTDVQLRWFQIRPMHRILPTSKYLSMCNLVDSPICKFCAREIETITHLLWHCEVVKRFWGELLITLQTTTTNCDNLALEEELILFGTARNIVTDKPLDLILLLAKFFVYRCKFQGLLPSVQAFLCYLKIRYKTEEMSFSVQGKKREFEQQWCPYKSLFN